MKSPTISFLAAVATLSIFAPLIIQDSAKAACLTVSGSNNCQTFDPTSQSDVTSTPGQFVGGVIDPNFFTQVRVFFATNGSWQNPFTVTDIVLTMPGPGSSTNTLTWNSLTVTPNFAWNTNTSSSSNATSFQGISFASAPSFGDVTLAYKIPANIANLGGANWSSISARIAFTDSNVENLLTSSIASRLQSTARNPAPAPLPLAGAVVTFSLSRRLRRRISKVS